MVKEHLFYMKKALGLAERAGEMGETPVGAVVVYQGKVVGRGYNLRESKKRPTAHAELLAIEAASRNLGRWRLENSLLYVSLEPCLMCWGAIVLARIPKVVYGAKDEKAGVCGSLLSLHKEDGFNHRPEVISGVLAEECGSVLSLFFQELRDKKRKKK